MRIRSDDWDLDRVNARHRLRRIDWSEDGIGYALAQVAVVATLVLIALLMVVGLS